MARHTISPLSKNSRLLGVHDVQSQKRKPNSGIAREFLLGKKSQRTRIRDGGKPKSNIFSSSKLSSSGRDAAHVHDRKRPPAAAAAAAAAATQVVVGRTREGRERLFDIAAVDASHDSLAKYAAAMSGEDDPNESTKDDNDADGSDDDDDDDDDGDEEEEGDWVDGSTLVAAYQEGNRETEEDRNIALVEYLEVPMQEKSQAIKQELCDILLDRITEIRQTQQKLEQGADIDRGKGIIIFNDICDKRHVDTSRACAEIKDSMSNSQTEIEYLFDQLKQAYARRSQLWIDLKKRLDEITKLQAALLDQLDENMEQTIASLEKADKSLLRASNNKSEKLLRRVLGKL